MPASRGDSKFRMGSLLFSLMDKCDTLLDPIDNIFGQRPLISLPNTGMGLSLLEDITVYADAKYDVDSKIQSSRPRGRIDDALILHMKNPIELPSENAISVYAEDKPSRRYDAVSSPASRHRHLSSSNSKHDSSEKPPVLSNVYNKFPSRSGTPSEYSNSHRPPRSPGYAKHSYYVPLPALSCSPRPLVR